MVPEKKAGIDYYNCGHGTDIQSMKYYVKLVKNQVFPADCGDWHSAKDLSDDEQQ